MGQEIKEAFFLEKDFDIFRSYLERETKLLQNWCCNNMLANDGLVGGFEIESWLLDQNFNPALVNEEFLHQFDNALASPELARFNVEFNNTPHLLTGSVFSMFQKELENTWKHANDIVAKLSSPSSLLLIGTLPTLMLSHLNENAMSDMNRYRALNSQIMARRKKRPLQVRIQGKELLDLGSDNVMLEATTTSFQIHTQVPAVDAHHYYNAAIMVSAPLLIVSANSPYIFGKDVWYETRIPLFEQSIDTNNPRTPIKRVSFGSGFLKESILECFQENLENFYILLPIVESDDGTLQHLRLHNGTIWRWNRPLIGFDKEGIPHFRIEHRPISAGPTFSDMVANSVFYFGLQHYWAQQLKEGLSPPDFGEVKNNFYTAARYGFDRSFTWFGKKIEPEELLIEHLLPQAEEGLNQLNIDARDKEKYLSIIAARASNQQTGATWQRRYVATHQCNMAELVAAYQVMQNMGNPVHTWDY